METLFTCCAGMDVHQKDVWVCVRRWENNGKISKEIKRFGTMTHELIELKDWLLKLGVTHAAMESTGVLWKPIYNVLEEHMEVWLCNARHVKNVPGRKTDAKDCDWLAQLMQCGLLRPSFVPPRTQRNLRDLARTRTCLEDDKTRVANRIHKVLEDANIKLSAVATDILGVSGRAMLQKIIDGQTDPEDLASLAKGRLKSKKPQLTQALRGYVSEHHRFMLRLELDQLRSLEAMVAVLDERIAEVMAKADAAKARAEAESAQTQPAAMAALPEAQEEKPPLPFVAALKLLIAIPGIKQRSAENILAEIGTDMSRFETDRHLASWAGMCPGNNISAGHSKSGATTKGNDWLRRALCQAAWAASRAKKSSLSGMFKRLVRKRGAQRTIVAVGHSMLTSIYHMLKDHVAYKDLGPEYYATLNKSNEKKMVKQLERLGYEVKAPAA
jgi:transposase